jgi:hypothetical protein
MITKSAFRGNPAVIAFFGKRTGAKVNGLRPFGFEDFG